MAPKHWHQEKMGLVHLKQCYVDVQANFQKPKNHKFLSLTRLMRSIAISLLLVRLSSKPNISKNWAFEKLFRSKECQNPFINTKVTAIQIHTFSPELLEFLSLSLDTYLHLSIYTDLYALYIYRCKSSLYIHIYILSIYTDLHHLYIYRSTSSLYIYRSTSSLYTQMNILSIYTDLHTLYK